MAIILAFWSVSPFHDNELRLERYQIRRKRKRVAVDPCLGFYTSSPRPPSPKNPGLDPEKTSAPQPEAAIDLPPIAVLTPLQDTSEDAHTSELSAVTEETNCEDQLDQVLTVEAFLRRSAEKPQKKYGNMKRKMADLEPVYEGLVLLSSIRCHTYIRLQIHFIS